MATSFLALLVLLVVVGGATADVSPPPAETALPASPYDFGVEEERLIEPVYPKPPRFDVELPPWVPPAPISFGLPQASWLRYRFVDADSWNDRMFRDLISFGRPGTDRSYP